MLLKGMGLIRRMGEMNHLWRLLARRGNPLGRIEQTGNQQITFGHRQIEIGHEQRRLIQRLFQGNTGALGYHPIKNCCQALAGAADLMTAATTVELQRLGRSQAPRCQPQTIGAVSGADQATVGQFLATSGAIAPMTLATGGLLSVRATEIMTMTAQRRLSLRRATEQQDQKNQPKTQFSPRRYRATNVSATIIPKVSSVSAFTQR